jgi:prepilin-type N-terminal cleavage/methylation domain-containing protein
MRYGLRQGQAIGRAGLTLIELMIASSLLSIILGAVLVLQLQGLRMYQDVSTRDWASFDAATAVARMEEEIQGCFRVTAGYPSSITLTKLRTQLNPVLMVEAPLQPLQAGDTVRYYLSDDTAGFDRSGTYLWRAIKPLSASTYTASLLAKDITQLDLTYALGAAPRNWSVAEVDLVVEASVRQGSQIRTCSHSGRIVLRNARLGPVTTEAQAAG